MKPSSDSAPIAPSSTSAFTASGLRSLTTHSWPPRRRRRTMLAPMRPRPIIPICIKSSLLSPGGLHEDNRNLTLRSTPHEVSAPACSCPGSVDSRCSAEIERFSVGPCCRSHVCVRRGYCLLAHRAAVQTRNRFRRDNGERLLLLRLSILCGGARRHAPRFTSPLRERSLHSRSASAATTDG